MKFGEKGHNGNARPKSLNPNIECPFKCLGVGHPCSVKISNLYHQEPLSRGGSPICKHQRLDKNKSKGEQDAKYGVINFQQTRGEDTQYNSNRYTK